MWWDSELIRLIINPASLFNPLRYLHPIFWTWIMNNPYCQFFKKCNFIIHLFFTILTSKPVCWQLKIYFIGSFWYHILEKEYKVNKKNVETNLRTLAVVAPCLRVCEVDLRSLPNPVIMGSGSSISSRRNKLLLLL